MKLKHKLLRDYQHLTNDKKIFLIKSGTIIDNYIYKIKDEEIIIDKDIIDANPDIFSPVDWKQELLIYIKSNKIPQPSQLQKKIIPFIEEMILMSNVHKKENVSEDLLKEIENIKYDISLREKKIKYKEEELELKSSLIEKKELEYKKLVKDLDIKENEIITIKNDLREQEIELNNRINDIKKKEREIDNEFIDKSFMLDSKYDYIKSNIEKDILEISNKEEKLEKLEKEITKREKILLEKENIISDRERDFNIKIEEYKIWENELLRINSEIEEWERLHWKFKKTKKPPSVL